jgi:hypothetical protein
LGIREREREGRGGEGRCTVAELVQDHGDSLAVFGGQDVVQQCGFARA